MLKPDQIPAEAVEAARKFMRLQALSDEWIDDLLAVAINAWPNVTTTSWFENGVRKAVLNIPLPQEKSGE